MPTVWQIVMHTIQSQLLCVNSGHLHVSALPLHNGPVNGQPRAAASLGSSTQAASESVVNIIPGEVLNSYSPGCPVCPLTYLGVGKNACLSFMKFSASWLLGLIGCIRASLVNEEG